MAFLRAMPAEQRGVFHSVLDALKSARDAVFRAGAQPLSDGQIAMLACETEDVLARTVPELVRTGFLGRDDDGALYSPHLVDRALRREERARIRAEREARAAEFVTRQEAGEFPSDADVRALTAPANGRFGGRPRKGETAEQAHARRAAAFEEKRRQHEMRLLSKIDGGPVPENAETKNQKPFSETVLVSGVSVSEKVSGFPVDLESEEKNIPSNSDSTKTPETETGPVTAPVSPEAVSQLAARIMNVSKLPENQLGFAKSMGGKWLREGIPADVIVQAIADHLAAMAKNGDVPQKMGVFRGKPEDAWADARAAGAVIDTARHDRAEWEIEGDAAYEKATREMSRMLQSDRDYGKFTRAWPDRARELGLPACEMTRDAYRNAYRPRDVAA
ncbi:hypothetical protein [Neoasaia chiangmaiensis]|nr:hypothetical protein [Neoasaia chiangmaiensis]